MKKISLLLCFMVHGWAIGYSQGVTAYGTTTGNGGPYSSYFGESAGGLQNGEHNTALGAWSLVWGTNGSFNTATGSHSLSSGGEGCTANGYQALHTNSPPYDLSATYDPGAYNTAVGFKSMQANYQGDYNTAVGAESLIKNKNNNNAAFGYYSLHENVDGSYNSAFGMNSMFANTTGYYNTAVGGRSLYSNTTGARNTATGMYSLHYNLLGSNNTATGSYALYMNNMGNNNTGHGYRALNANTTGSYNTAQGSYALDDNAGGDYNTAVGYNAGPAVDLLSNTTAIGYLAIPTASNQVRIGNASVTSIGGQVAWTVFSDGRFKKDVKEDVSGLEFIRQLRPVSYTVDNAALNKFLHVRDSSINSSQAKNVPVRQTGFIAQEVEALVKKTGYVFSGVDTPENENDPYGIRYSEFVVPLVKAAQELSAQVQELSAEVEEQRRQIQSLLGQIDSKNGVTVNTQAVLLQNNPNPFDAETAVKMTLPDNVGMASVMIYNLEGKQMKSIQVQSRGDVTVKISASELAAGMYLYSLIVDGKVVDTKRMVLTK